MDKNAPGDLYLIAENLAQDSSLVPEAEEEFDPPLRGVLTEAEVLRQAEVLDNMDIDSYIEPGVTGAEDPKRVAAPDVIRRLGTLETEDRLEALQAFAEKRKPKYAGR